ncbi:MAG: RES family NAD+ phosphorylase [Bryobacterales bacterium]|nr:RES family NAD+ phosphorylase [Bryobacterales bacterium]
MSPPAPFVACSNCFVDEGLRLDAEHLGEDDHSLCPRCAASKGRKLTSHRLATLAQGFFVWGSLRRFDYGSAPRIQFNDRLKSDIELPGSLNADAAVFEDALGIGFFPYEPRSWMFGEVEPLEALQCYESRSAVIARILREYGSRTLTVQNKFYRIRKNPDEPSRVEQYDSPPAELSNGRLNTAQLPVLYASPDLQTCLHECRVTAEDDLFMATLRPARDLKLLDVAALLDEPRRVSEFESLDLAVNMLFLAGTHSYPIARELSHAAQSAGFDGIVYPSYFSMLRNGVKPFETTYGMWHRRIPQYRKFEEAKVSANFAIFGRPIQEGLVDVCCINRVVLSTVLYGVHFGPGAGYE